MGMRQGVLLQDFAGRNPPTTVDPPTRLNYAVVPRATRRNEYVFQNPVVILAITITPAFVSLLCFLVDLSSHPISYHNQDLPGMLPGHIRGTSVDG